MFAYIKTQIENPALPKSGFTLDSIMHLDISFHKLQLTRGSSYIKPPVWIANKEAVINPKNKKDEECFKWAVIAALHHEDIQKDLQRISKLEPYSDLVQLERAGLSCGSQHIDKFEKNNKDIAVNVLYLHCKEESKSKGKITILRRFRWEYNSGQGGESTPHNRWRKEALYSYKEFIETTNKGKCKQQTSLSLLPELLAGILHWKVTRNEHYANCIDHDAVKTEMPVERRR